MALIDDVKTLCDRLAPLGWRQLLLDVTANKLDIKQTTADKLKTALTQNLTSVDRNRVGFQDFHGSGQRGVTAGAPAQSLLYHALASPYVHPTGTATPSDDAAYPTLAELDTLENFIYAQAAASIDLAGLVIAVFAYQYREASRTTHLRHADLAFSRTGVARVGTAAQRYDGSRRGFWVIPVGGGDALPVLPARYAAFLARRAKPGVGGTVQGASAGATQLDYVFPVHKLFAGTECLAGKTITLKFLEYHINEKLRAAHLLAPKDGGLPTPAGFDLNKPPFVRDSRNDGNLAGLVAAGASTLVVPKPAARLVRTAIQRTADDVERIAHFVVPKATNIRKSSTRFTVSTLEIPRFESIGDGPGERLAPEYVNIRHEVDPDGPPDQIPQDLNKLKPGAFEKKLTDGNYPAAHFSDDSCDGVVEAVVGGISAGANLPAFSLITAPDFFPLADQIEIAQDPTIIRTTPLSFGRLPVSPRLPRPSKPPSPAFARTDLTVTAVVGASATGPQASIIGHPNRSISFLPDGASDVFAPGWDTSRSRDAQGVFLSSLGLGSPFPEDAKLCAALSSFWPAVAPDASRTFGNNGLPNQLPMLDEELGLHPSHERVKSGAAQSFRGWDGEFGPFFETVGAALHVNFASIVRSDYVSHALAGRIRVSLTADVQTEQLIARHQALDRCTAILQVPDDAELCLVVARSIANWQTSEPGVAGLQGSGFLLEFAEMEGEVSPTHDLTRVRRRVAKRHICQFGANGIAYKSGSAAFQFFPA